ncbi:MAG: hypothetical protein R3E95_12210 [Thiolinea sp.]
MRPKRTPCCGATGYTGLSWAALLRATLGQLPGADNGLRLDQHTTGLAFLQPGFQPQLLLAQLPVLGDDVVGDIMGIVHDDIGDGMI